MGNDYFVVVQTTEAGRPVITVVPHRWVAENTLFWPPKQANTLRKNAASTPAPSWSKLTCTVKRKFIPTFAEAEQEADDLSGQSTDASDFMPQRKKKLKKTPNNPEFDLNHLITSKEVLAQATSPPAKHEPTKANFTKAQIVTQEHEGIVCPPDLNNLVTSIPLSGHRPPRTILTDIPSSISAQSSELIYCQPELNNLFANSQGALLDYDRTLSGSTASNNAMVTEGYVVNIQQPDADKIIKVVTDIIEKAREQTVTEVTGALLPTFEAMLAKTAAVIEMKIDAVVRSTSFDQYPEASSSFQFSPVATTEEIDALENKLNDELYAKQLFTYMKKIVGYNGDDCNGLNIAYGLIDHFFDRKVMLVCSWTGESKGESMKYPIRKCVNILDIFFKLVRSVNSTFSRSLLEDFCKRITRNSKKRSEAKGKRQSSIHRRAKSRNEKKVVERDNNFDPEDEDEQEWETNSEAKEDRQDNYEDNL